MAQIMSKCSDGYGSGIISIIVYYYLTPPQNLKPKCLSMQCIGSSEPLPLLQYLILTQAIHHKIITH